jgi:hypothetical protein
MPFEYDFQNTIIEAGSDDVTIQALINSIRAAEATVSGIAFPHIANASGKETLADLGGGETVEVGITVDLQNGWQLHFLPSGYTVTIEGGNLVGGLGGDPVSYSAGVQVLLIQSASATLVTAAGGSGLSQSEHDQLFALPDEDAIADQVWDEVLTGATHDVATSAGKRLRQLGNVIDGAVVDVSPTTLRFESNLSATYSGFYNDQTVRFTSGDLEGQARIILDYDNVTQAILVDEPWSIAPSDGDDFEVVPDHTHPVQQIVDELDIPSLQSSVEDALGLANENTVWSGMAFDSNNYLISAVVTQYTDNTLAVERKKWQLTASYDVQGRITSYQFKEY